MSERVSDTPSRNGGNDGAVIKLHSIKGTPRGLPPGTMPKYGFKKGHDPRRSVVGRKGKVQQSTKDIKNMARYLVEDKGYLEKLKERLEQGKAPHMETLLYHYAYGRPVTEVALSGLDQQSQPNFDLSKLSTDKLKLVLGILNEARTEPPPPQPPGESPTGTDG